MTAVATVMPAYRPVSRFLRTPKGMLIVVFAGILAFASLAVAPAEWLPHLGVALVVCAALDVAVLAVKRESIVFPDGALLTGAIIAMVLRPQEPLLVVAATAAAAIVAKHALRTRWSNVLNPAAAALVFSSIVFGTGQSWWGALPGLGLGGALLVVGAGAFMADRINKLPMAIAFLGVLLAMFTVSGFFSDPALTAEIFATPDIHALLFFTFFMLDDPPTSPVRYEDQVVYGVIVATIAYAIFVILGAVYFLPAALLLGNAWESGRRLFFARRRSR